MTLLSSPLRGGPTVEGVFVVAAGSADLWLQSTAVSGPNISGTADRVKKS
jgi:hypothetical protein